MDILSESISVTEALAHLNGRIRAGRALSVVWRENGEVSHTIFDSPDAPERATELAEAKGGHVFVCRHVYYHVSSKLPIAERPTP